MKREEQKQMIGIISDVHANLEALEAVLDKLEEMGVEKIYNAGDIVDYCANPNEVVELLRNRKVKSIVGNHDYYIARGTDVFFIGTTQWTIDELTTKNKKYIHSLPFSLHLDLFGKKVFIYHGSPRDPLKEYVYENYPRKLLTEFLTPCDILILGHTHIPMLINIGKKHIINPGSVGQPRDGNNKSSFATIDKNLNIKNYRVKYDIKNATKKIYEKGLPNHFAERLY
ncbi:MAG: metallophosphoesterase family protein [Candidatus Methanofastidiosia archaeon]